MGKNSTANVESRKIDDHTAPADESARAQKRKLARGPRVLSDKMLLLCTCVRFMGVRGVRQGKVGKQHESEKVAKVQNGKRIEGAGGYRSQNYSAILAPKRGAVTQNSKIW